MKIVWAVLVSVAMSAVSLTATANDSTAPIARPDLVFDEADGIVAVEAEHFYKQTRADKRAWHIISSKQAPEIKPDADPSHAAGASGGAYVEILPDTRVTHGDKLIKGENFTDEPGQMAVLHYKVRINTPANNAPSRFTSVCRCSSFSILRKPVNTRSLFRCEKTGSRWTSSCLLDARISSPRAQGRR